MRTGGAGTGKTLLAIEHARRLAAGGHRVLVTCFNAPLAGHIRSQLHGVPGVEVFHFHLLCRRWAEDAGIDVSRRPGEPDRGYYEDRLPDALVDAAASPGRGYDASVVDEAQDFASTWIDALQLLLTDRHAGVTFLFADENQAIYQRGFGVPDGFVRYRLTGNLRNAGSIHRLLVRHFGEESKARGPEGLDVVVRTYGDRREMCQELSALLSNFERHGVPPAEVAVLTGRSVADSALAAYADTPLGSFRLVGRPARRNDVRLESVHRHKGQEASVVVLCEMDDLRPAARRQVWYTGVSRPRVALVFMVRDRDGSLVGGDADAVLTAVLEDGGS